FQGVALSEAAQEVLGPEIAEILPTRAGGRVDRPVQAAIGSRTGQVDVEYEGRLHARGEKRLGDRVDLGSLEAPVHQREVLSADVEAVGIRSEQGLVTEAWAVCSVGGRVQHEDVESVGRVARLAHRDQLMGGSGEVARRRVDVELEQDDEEAIRLRIEVAARV